MGLVAGIIVAASTGGIVEIAPLFTIQRTVEIPADLRRRRRWNWGARSTCARAAIACHSQMIRTPADEIDRHGPYSVVGESAWDFPTPWGSKRTGPDIARLVGKYSDDWHVARARWCRPRSCRPVPG